VSMKIFTRQEKPAEIASKDLVKYDKIKK